MVSDTELTTRDWLAAELQRAHSVVIYINPAVGGVQAPAHLTAKPSFTLLVSHHFDRPLIFRKDDLKSDFSFDFGFQTCTLPWGSIWAAHPEGETKKIVFWNEHSPGPGWDKALRTHLAVSENEEKQAQEKTAPKAKAEVKPLIAIKSGAEPKSKKKRSRSHLKLVK